VVAVVPPEVYRLDDPAPVVPSRSSYSVTPVPGVHVKVTLEPASTLLGVGEVIVAGAFEPSVTVTVTVTMLEEEAG